MARCDGWLCPPNPPWDTLLFLGNPGDRWNDGSVDLACYPYGMLEIQDTGHVIIQGITLRTWDLARLDQNGLPIPEENFPNFGDSLSIIERLQGNTWAFPQPCDGEFLDSYWWTLQHYSDVDISLPEGSTCDITTGQLELPHALSIVLHPNPGNTFQLTGLHGRTAQLRLLDMQGRMVRDGFMISERTTVDAEDLLPGTYIVEVHFADGARQALRWVKE